MRDGLASGSCYWWPPAPGPSPAMSFPVRGNAAPSTRAAGLRIVADKHGAAAAAAQQEAAKHGLLMLTCGAWSPVVRFIPALIVDSEQVQRAVSIWADAVDAVL